ncbi:FCD domain-containing protein [Arthrobacter sp.]|uniref:FCD domain-containing protein n=1 Tax=Arthrobacter sp. TaxID=1667 RepID=UPI00338DA02F
MTGRRLKSDHEHRLILDAIARGNAGEAGRAMAVHLNAVDAALTLIIGDTNA